MLRSFIKENKFLKLTTFYVIMHISVQLITRLRYSSSIGDNNGRQFISNQYKQFCSIHSIEPVENMNKSILKTLQKTRANRQQYWRFMTLQKNRYQQLLSGRNIRGEIPDMSDLLQKEEIPESRDNNFLIKHKKSNSTQTNSKVSLMTRNMRWKKLRGLPQLIQLIMGYRARNMRAVF